VNDLAAPFEMSLQAVSKHVRVLERAGLIAQRREAQRRPCQIQAVAIKQVADWAEHYRTLWEQRLDRLEDYLNELQTPTPKKEKSHARKHRKQK
jgi:DNA-binding transcriptional ArsR family regulator